MENGEIKKMACTFLDVDSDSGKVPLMSSMTQSETWKSFFYFSSRLRLECCD